MELLICPKIYREGHPCGIVACAPEPELWRRESVNLSVSGQTITSIEWDDNKDFPSHAGIKIKFSDGVSSLYISAIE